MTRRHERGDEAGEKEAVNQGVGAMRPAADLLRPAVLLLLLDFSGGLTGGAIPELTPMVLRALGEEL